MSPIPCYNRRMNNTQLQLIEEKYGKLLHKIAHNISGDYALASHEDNVQDLWVAVIHSIDGYAKKENLTFDEFWGSVGFDKYIKTCLWNLKNNKGAKITQKFNINRDTVSISDNEEVLTIIDDSVPDPELDLFLEDSGKILTEDEMRIVSCIIRDPNFIKPSGKVCTQAVATELDKPWHEARKVLDSISQKIQNQL